jgi:hypothetical protein
LCFSPGELLDGPFELGFVRAFDAVGGIIHLVFSEISVRLLAVSTRGL